MSAVVFVVCVVVALAIGFVAGAAVAAWFLLGGVRQAEREQHDRGFREGHWLGTNEAALAASGTGVEVEVGERPDWLERVLEGVEHPGPQVKQSDTV